MKTNFYTALAAFLCLTTLCMAAPQAEETIVYKSTPEADLEMIVLRPDSELTKKDKKGTPAILFFYGGGFKNGKIDQLRPQAEILRDKGMVAILVDYRVQSRHNVLPDRGISDGLSAMRYVRENAKKLGINPDMIACSGASAGGHIAASVAFVDVFSDPSDNLKISPIPNALVLFNPGVTNEPMPSNESSLFRQIDRDWRDFSPMHNIGTKKAPATIFFVGDKDEFVSIETSEAFRDAIEATGAEFRLKVYEGCEHTFFNSYKHDGKYFKLTMDETVQFLTDLGYIDSATAESTTEVSPEPADAVLFDW